MTEPLDHLLTQFSLRAGVFYTGNICGLHDFEHDALRGHLHLVKSGPVQLVEPGKTTIVIERPTLVFLPRPQAHRLLADERAGADVVCATVMLGGGGSNPITDSLPDTVLIALEQMEGLQQILDVMFAEAFDERSGRQSILNRLCEVLMICMLRHCLEQEMTHGGALSGLADPKLAKALEAIHHEPARDWNLVSMAAQAGKPPAAYLASWRVMLAQRLLARGLPAKSVALDVGMQGQVPCTGRLCASWACRPREWLRQQADIE